LLIRFPFIPINDLLFLKGNENKVTNTVQGMILSQQQFSVICINKPHDRNYFLGTGGNCRRRMFNTIMIDS